ncbi:T9SS C-terminal target domain-containing protein [Dokdonia sinensis]|uniref:T9SS C-terminal target domain-containing protein n=1 Tax=Dokdonia sinensis TaxID=2479847 RepID=A0A3M0GMA9_9FLAO|nr:M14 family zinc carboxypeptidase [Dokdonia sinensis]RMB63852.1 T9SS C-terminal target domain-containing protein [Dokdonia sinensis]
MKKITLLTALICALSVFSQDSPQRISISNIDQSKATLLTDAGIDLRCGAQINEGNLILELGPNELNTLKDLNVDYKVEIEDLFDFYKEQTDRYLPIAKRELELSKRATKATKTSTGSVILDSFLQTEGTQEVDWVTPTNFKLGASMMGCLTISEVESEMNLMHSFFPNLISAKMDAGAPSNTKTYGNTLGTATWGPQTVYYSRMTSDQDSDEGTKPQILITSMIHAREVSALMSNMFFMWYLLENYATDPAIKHLLDNNEIYFIPVVNPDGLLWNETIAPSGGGFQRKNLRVNSGDSGTININNNDRGVDLNRNFDYFFGSAGSGSSGVPSADSYRGPNAFSEPESRILRDFVLSRNFETGLMNHSFANGIPHPYGGNPTFTSGREDEMHKMHEDMTKYNRYVSGATIFSAANGIADDWMLGGNIDGNGSVGSGQNILATTPEHGGTGFWPNPTDITPIAKTGMRIYLTAVYYGGKYARLHDLTQSDIATITADLDFGIERVGLAGSNFSIELSPVSSNIVSMTSPTTQSLTMLEQKNVSGTVTLDPSIQPNDIIEYNVKLRNEDNVVIYDVNIKKYFQPSVIFADDVDANGLSNWTVTGDWSTTNQKPYAGSPSGNTSIRSTATIPYVNNGNGVLTTSTSYSLTDVSEAVVQFYTKWDLERNFDFVEIQGSTNGTSWTPLTGKYNKPEAQSNTNDAHGGKIGLHGFQSGASSGLVYDGDQMDKWVMEEIEISAAKNSFLLGSPTAFFRFRFRSDANQRPESYSTTYEGFSIDDFKIIGPQVPCALSVPTNISVSNLATVSATISWDAIPSASFDLRYRESGTPSWTTIVDITTPTYDLTGLSQSTQYEVQVRTKCDTDVSDYSTLVNFTTPAPGAYCTSNGNNSSEEYISNVSLGTIDNPSTLNESSSGYTDYTSITPADITLNSTPTISVEKSFVGGPFTDAVSVWIDYNQDGDFDDPGEQVIEDPSSTNSLVNVAFSNPVPADALIGNTRMRVVMKFQGGTNNTAAPASCGTYNFGETEDYTVNIVEGPTCEMTTIYNGSWNNGFPDSAKEAIINSSLTLNTLDLESCSLTIEAGATLTINAGHYARIQGDIVVNGTLIIAHEGSLVQVDNNANVTKNAGGVIEVHKTSLDMKPRDFMFMSSPMTAETRDGVFGNVIDAATSTLDQAFRVIYLNPENFQADPVVTGYGPYAGAETFLSVDNTFLGNHNASEAIIPGEGYIIYPQDSYLANGITTTYDFNFNKGTLNNGIVNYPIQYNGTTIDNFNLIGNPYASAIDINKLIAANPMINEVYFWEHVTTPNNSLPGYLGENPSMQDFSMRNLTTGMPAVNNPGSTPSQFIASGQGFAIKADQAYSTTDPVVTFTNEMRSTGNNDQFKNTAEEKDLIWLKISNELFELESKTAIGFLPQATEKLDKGYDSKRLGTPLSIFSLLKDGTQLGIQGLGEFDNTKVIPIGFATAIEQVTTYSISLDDITGPSLQNTEVYLIDTTFETYTNLREKPHVFTATTANDGNRFYLAFNKNETLGINQESVLSDSIAIYPNPVKERFTISYDGRSILLKAIVTDVQGKMIQEFDLSNFKSLKSFDLANYATGIYFVQIQSSAGVVVKRILKQ